MLIRPMCGIRQLIIERRCGKNLRKQRIGIKRNWRYKPNELIRCERRRLGESRSGDQKSQQRQSYSDRLHLILYRRRTADARVPHSRLAILPVFCSMSRAYFLRCRQLMARPKRRTAAR